MAVQAEASAHIDPQLVANSFVEQYYKVLHQFPEQLHRFYQDSSFLSRLGTDGVMVTVTTAKGISEQIVSLDYQNYQTELLTVDAQGSYCSGVIALVTGYLIDEKDNEKRKFVQSFFLAPQENGFYVLNDVFRYVDEKPIVGMPIIDVVESAPLYPLTPHSEPTNVPNHSPLAEEIDNHKETDNTLQNGQVLVPDHQKGNNVVNNPDDSNQNAVQTVSTATDSPVSPKKFQNNIQTVTGTDSPETNQNNTQNVPETDSPRTFQNNIQTVPGTDSPRTIQNDVQTVPGTDSPRSIQNDVQTVPGTDSPRSIQNDVQTVPGTDSPRTIQNDVQTVTGTDSFTTFQNDIQAKAETDSPQARIQDDGSKKSFASIVNKLKENKAPFQIRVPPPNYSRMSRVTAPSKASAPSNNIPLKENTAKSNSIFVANLPMDVTVEQLKQTFMTFGPIKANGIRVRTNQLRPNCFSFIEFESVDSVQNAIKASPIMFGDRKVFIEEKRGPGNDTTAAAAAVRRTGVVGNQSDNLKLHVSSNGRKPQGSSTVGRVGVNSPKAKQNNEAGRVQSKVIQKEGGK